MEGVQIVICSNSLQLWRYGLGDMVWYGNTTNAECSFVSDDGDQLIKT